MNNSGPGPNGPHGPTLGEKWMMIVIVLLAAVALLGWCRPVDGHPMPSAYCDRWGDLALEIARDRFNATEAETMARYRYLGDRGEYVVRVAYQEPWVHPRVVHSVVRLRCETDWTEAASDDLRAR